MGREEEGGREGRREEKEEKEGMGRGEGEEYERRGGWLPQVLGDCL